MTENTYKAIYIARCILCTNFTNKIQEALIDANPYICKFAKEKALLSTPLNLLYKMSLDSELEISKDWTYGYGNPYCVLVKLSMKVLDQTTVCIIVFANNLVMLVGGCHENDIYFMVEASSGHLTFVESPDNCLNGETQEFKAIFLKKKNQKKRIIIRESCESKNKKLKI